MECLGRSSCQRSKTSQPAQAELDEALADVSKQGFVKLSLSGLAINALRSQRER